MPSQLDDFRCCIFVFYVRLSLCVVSLVPQLILHAKLKPLSLSRLGSLLGLRVSDGFRFRANPKTGNHNAELSVAYHLNPNPWQGHLFRA